MDIQKILAELGIKANNSGVSTGLNWKKGEGETIWFKVTFWNSKADSVMDSIRKGDRIIVIGEFTESKWEKDGIQKSRIGITGSYWAPDPKAPKNAAPFVKSVHETEEAPW